jgi:hypothetical protein
MKSTNSANWILVTGTSTGIGRAATFTLAENGYRVLAAVRKQEDIESLLAEAGTRRVVGSVEPIILDVTDAGQIAAAVEIVRARIAAGGRLHAIVRNAGAQLAGPIETMPLTEWRSQFDLLFFGPIALTQQLLPQLRLARTSYQRDLNRQDNPGSDDCRLPGGEGRVRGGERLDADGVLPIRRSCLRHSSRGHFHADAQPVLRPDQQARGCPAEKPSARLCGCPPGVREDCRVRPQTFNLSGEGIADDPPGGDGAPSPNPLPDRDGREALRVSQAQPSRPLDGCDHLPAGWSAAAGKAPGG